MRRPPLATAVTLLAAASLGPFAPVAGGQTMVPTAPAAGDEVTGRLAAEANRYADRLRDLIDSPDFAGDDADPLTAFWARADLASLYGALGRRGDARAQAEEAARIVADRRAELGADDLAVTPISLASAFAAAGDYERALDLIDGVADVDERGQALDDLATTIVQAGDARQPGDGGGADALAVAGERLDRLLGDGAISDAAAPPLKAGRWATAAILAGATPPGPDGALDDNAPAPPDDPVTRGYAFVQMGSHHLWHGDRDAGVARRWTDAGLALLDDAPVAAPPADAGDDDDPLFADVGAADLARSMAAFTLGALGDAPAAERQAGRVADAGHRASALAFVAGDHLRAGRPDEYRRVAGGAIDVLADADGGEDARRFATEMLAYELAYAAAQSPVFRTRLDKPPGPDPMLLAWELSATAYALHDSAALARVAPTAPAP